MKDVIKKKLNRLVEAKIHGQEGITKKIAQLTREIEILRAQRTEINVQRNLKTNELKDYKTGVISPNQTTLF